MTLSTINQPTDNGIRRDGIRFDALDRVDGETDGTLTLVTSGKPCCAQCGKPKIAPKSNHDAAPKPVAKPTTPVTPPATGLAAERRALDADRARYANAWKGPIK